MKVNTAYGKVNMPKPFYLGVEIEETALGSVMRKINKLPGVIAIKIDFQNKPPKKKSPGKEEDADQMLKRLMGKEARTVKQIRELFVADGRSPKSVNGILHKMKKRGELVSNGRGSWRLKG